jgi:hypothetical protein
LLFFDAFINPKTSDITGLFLISGTDYGQSKNNMPLNNSFDYQNFWAGEICG